MGPKNFGWAIAMLKEGKKVCRAGWNGKGMWLFLVNARDYTIMTVNPNISAMDANAEKQPFIMMKTAQGMIVPWLASQSDMLAEDWDIVD